MSDLLKKIPAGEIVAENVAYEDYRAQYTGTETRYEWVEGFVIQMSPNTSQHKGIVDYLVILLEDYFHLKPLGVVERDLSIKSARSVRMPDIAVLLSDMTLTPNIPDICIEVVSHESSPVDYNDKRATYQCWGVREYWIIDPNNQVATFLRLQDDGIYGEIPPNAHANYQTPLLPKLNIDVPILWQSPLPHNSQTWLSVKAMLAEE